MAPSSVRRAPNRLEWALLLVCLGALALLWRLTSRDTLTVALNTSTPEGACQLLAQAMLHSNSAEIKRLTTSQGYASLQKALRHSRFNTYPKLGQRLIAEWGRPIFWQGAALSGPRATFGVRRAVKPGEAVPELRLLRTGKWQLDAYVPGPDRLIVPLARLGPTWQINNS